ncbi:MAG: DUF1566 domain-containing protein [Treponema sp.]|jgi:hypothetical protein|nr:DUF1566 domain-containing protein [Treponema sp.]
MKKILVLAIMGIVCVLAVSAQTAASLDAAIDTSCKAITQKLVMAPKVAVVSFASTDQLSAYVLQQMRNTLEKSKAATWIPKQEIEKALTAASLKPSAELSDAQARDIGRKTGALFVVIGTFAEARQNYAFKTKMINVASGTVETSSDIAVSETAQIANLLGKPAPVETPAAAATASGTGGGGQATQAQAAANYKIGDTGPAGGLIFYDKGDGIGGWRYLEAAPADIGKTNRAVTEDIRYTGLYDRAVGRGKSNTQGIMTIAANRGGGFGWVAQICDTYSLNGFDDWYLPSRDELNYMYGNLYLRELGNFKSEYYWSSTVSTNTYSRNVDFKVGRSFWIQNFNTGNQVESPKNLTASPNIRPIRQF